MWKTVLAMVPLMAAQAGATDQGIARQLDAIYQQYLAGPDIARLVTLDANIRDLLLKPWRRARESVNGAVWKPSWSAMGIEVGHYSDSLEYSGRLLVQAHRINPRSEFRRFTLFAAVTGERPSHGLGEMPDVDAARQYLKEFPDGPFALDVLIILGDFYSDLFKVLKNVQQGLPRDYKYDCFSKYIRQGDIGEQAATAQRLSASFYAQAAARAPAEWAETRDLRQRRMVMQAGDPEAIDALGWHFCAD